MYCVISSINRVLITLIFFPRWSRNPIFYKLSTNLTGAAHTAFYADALAHAGKAPEVVSVDHTRLFFPSLSFNEYAMPERNAIDFPFMCTSFLADCWNSVKAMTEIIYGGNAQVPLSVHGIPVNPRHFHVTNSNRNTPVRTHSFPRGSTSFLCYIATF